MLKKFKYDDDVIHQYILSGKVPIKIDGASVIINNMNEYKKDLTRCGDVESNPGPTTRKNGSKKPQIKTNNNALKNTTSRSVTAPVAKAKIDKLTKPKYSMPKQNGDGRVCIKHREYIADIAGSVNFTAVEYPINPGLVNTFPWLGTLAIAYESYKFKHLSFIFESSKSTTTNGSVMMTVDFDPNDDGPSTKAQALAYNNAIRGPPWETFTYVCSKGDLAKLNQKFIRYGALTTGQDSILYDVGNLFVCTSGLADTSVIGELHVEFEVEFYTPQFDLTAYALSTSAKIVSSAGITAAAWLGTTTVTTGGLGPTISGGGTTLTIPSAGQYLINYSVDGVTLAQPTPPTFSSTGNTVQLLTSTVSATRISYLVWARIDVPATGITISNSITGTLNSAVTRISYYAVSLT